MKEAFNIKYRPQIESKTVKISTRDGRTVNILKWDACNNLFPIIGTVIRDNIEWPACWTSEGRCSESVDAPSDLVIITETLGLTEFEENLLKIIRDCNDSGLRKRYQEYYKEASATLLDVARKELMLNCEDKYREGRSAGIIETLKEMPKWHKADVEAFTIAGGMLYYKGYKIDISELEKLPKED